MRWLVYEIDRRDSYMFAIGTRAEPDSRLRERIRRDIDKAMRGLEREEGAKHSVIIEHSLDKESGDPELPSLSQDKQYLIFALLYTEDSAGAPSDIKLEEQQKRIKEGLTEFIRGHSATISLVVLHDCSVDIITGSRPEQVTVGSTRYA